MEINKEEIRKGLKFYNTEDRKLEDFQPLQSPHVGMSAARRSTEMPTWDMLVLPSLSTSYSGTCRTWTIRSAMSAILPTSVTWSTTPMMARTRLRRRHDSSR